METIQLTVTEDFKQYGHIDWTVREGRTTIARLRLPEVQGTFDLDILRETVAQQYGTPLESVEFQRQESDRDRVAPRSLRVSIDA